LKEWIGNKKDSVSTLTIVIKKGSGLVC